MRRFLRKIKRSLELRALKRHHEGLIVGANATIIETSFGRFNFVADNCSIRQSKIGDFSYVAKGSEIGRANIGNFSSIGQEVRIGLGTHPTNMVSTHPIFYSTQLPTKNRFADKQYFDDLDSISIGHDVWIGSRAIIFDGVSIGNGAIIAANAVVNKNVDPYDIVGGIPAKPIRKRFDENTIAMLNESRWWERDINWIKQNYQAFHSTEAFQRLLLESD